MNWIQNIEVWNIECILYDLEDEGRGPKIWKYFMTFAINRVWALYFMYIVVEVTMNMAEYDSQRQAA